MNLIEIIKTVIIGIIEGITEWLPISSTGHMILADEFIKLNVSEAFMEMFLVVIQLGAILAVIILYFNRLNPFSPKKTGEEKKQTWILWFKVAVASIPAGVIGFLFNDRIDALFYNYQTVAFTLVLYGVVFLIIEQWNKNRQLKNTSVQSITYKSAFIIGVFQLLSLVPGTSRSGATIIGAMLIGTSRAAAAEFSFFLAIPAMFGASAYKIAKFGFGFQPGEAAVLFFGMVTAFIVSVIAIRFLMDYIRKHDFKLFGIYRIALGVLVLGYFLLKN
ncbi:MAG: undecaprenyl-diphosphate phosphatase [Clostridiales bacterium]|jgi:undecaprenyl-diphosphatase|nr:undecaprenyl-diphosphate phosphatase [Clostridiales bacterium]